MKFVRTEGDGGRREVALNLYSIFYQNAYKGEGGGLKSQKFAYVLDGSPPDISCVVALPC